MKRTMRLIIVGLLITVSTTFASNLHFMENAVKETEDGGIGGGPKSIK